MQEKLALAELIGTNQGMKERLTIAFASYRTPVSLPYTPVLESFNSKSSEQSSAPKNHLSPQLLSALDTLLAKESRLL